MDGEFLFPGNVFEAKSNPYIEIHGSDGQVQAHISQPGTYELTWTDGKKSIVKAEDEVKEIPVTGSWELSFDPEWGGPEKVIIDELKSWTEFAEEGIKYYSGTAVYKKVFEISNADLTKNCIILDLGNLHELADVHLNGKRIGNVWHSPFSLDISDAVNEGINELELEVVNLWPNRLILDGRLPDKKRLTTTNVIKFEAEEAENHLRKSGLIGPVTIQFSKIYDIQN